MLSQQSVQLIFFSIFSIFCKDVVVSQSVDDVEIKFLDYILQFNKSYRHNVDEYRRRLALFQTSLEMIESMNKLRKDENSASFGFTEYSDMSHDEFLTIKLAPNSRSSYKTLDSRRMNLSAFNIIRYTRNARDVCAEMNSLPQKVDWRERGVVTSVRNQGLCGACWAYGVIETVESMVALKRNSSAREYSIQQMIDCAANNKGCLGGDTCNLLQWLVQENVHIQTTEAYPINNTDGRCKMGEMKNDTQTVRVNKFTCDSFVGREHVILYLLANYGPVVTAVNGLLWQNYLGGIIQFHCDGAVPNLNHAVQIVGYDRTGDVPYYIVRNSWGERFGNKGYLYIQIGDNVCGVANQVSTLTADIDTNE
ncbi:Cathepsin O [Pseudolycoriella hygida]|uniref:Cathepsin O n=1 Tax=Pseudolycoriella hygida TaxID=35572 RepID=A0A9Q0RVT5_9DIPT|nr:Cathepsin O [Pseudolycoriella hygida]